MSEPIDDQAEFFRRLQYGPFGEYTVTNRLIDEIEDAYGPIGGMRAAWDSMYAEALRFFEDHTQTVPPPALCGPSSSVPPRETAAEEDRVARELVPLVRAAATEVPLPKRVDVLGGHLRTSRTADDAVGQHVSDVRWARYQEENYEEEASAFARYLDRVLDSTLIVQPPQPHPNDDLYTTVLAAYEKLLAPPLRQRQVRTEPIKLTREQIGQIPKAPRLEPFVPGAPAAVWLDGVPVVEVATVEESTPYVEGWISA